MRVRMSDVADAEVTLPSSERPDPLLGLNQERELSFCKCKKGTSCPVIRLVSPDGAIEIFDVDRGLPRGQGLPFSPEDVQLLKRWLNENT